MAIQGNVCEGTLENRGMGQGTVNDRQLISKMVHDCSSCGECLRDCSFLQFYGTPAVIAGRGKAESNLLSAFSCSLCGLCDAVCPELLSPSSMFLEMRREAVSKGLLDLTPYSPWLHYETLGSSCIFKRHFIPEGCNTVFFPGCSLAGTRPEAVKNLFAVLLKFEPTAGLVLDCCGKISHDLGLSDRFERVIDVLSRGLQDSGVTRILTACPGCSKILRKYGSGL